MTKPRRTRAERGLWWDESLGLVQGCTKVSRACKHCWAETLHNRFREYLKLPPFSEVRFREDRLDIPFHQKAPTVYAVWNDLFHEAINAVRIARAVAAGAEVKRHTIIILTKRIERAAELAASALFRAEVCDTMGRLIVNESRPVAHALRDWPPQNIIIGTTVEDQRAADERMPHLARLAALGWRTVISAEPLLERIELDLITTQHDEFAHVVADWLIIGCESGAQRRPCDLEWVRDLIEQADDATVPVWVKQVNRWGKVSNDPAEWPEWARRRERPEVTHG